MFYINNHIVCAFTFVVRFTELLMINYFLACSASSYEKLASNHSYTVLLVLIYLVLNEFRLFRLLKFTTFSML
ncbi:hypothetical protein MIMGU_mgv11b021042mg [Erythranthe guttata]|uniref:Uncharacterized protein n=1 Tax=Erythranthe guttata TaxID=4155 RepID=A0A022QLM0_ERYGU|nr:hypothetical protein MIMGU_mgv11b021042mg [Erythranthe guttata]